MVRSNIYQIKITLKQTLCQFFQRLQSLKSNLEYEWLQKLLSYPTYSKIISELKLIRDNVIRFGGAKKKQFSLINSVTCTLLNLQLLQLHNLGRWQHKYFFSLPHYWLIWGVLSFYCHWINEHTLNQRNLPPYPLERWFLHHSIYLKHPCYNRVDAKLRYLGLEKSNLCYRIKNSNNDHTTSWGKSDFFVSMKGTTLATPSKICVD